jgi:hypothetical protein
MALGIKGRNDPGNVKEPDGKSNVLPDKGDKETFLKTTSKEMENRPLRESDTANFPRIAGGGAGAGRVLTKITAVVLKCIWQVPRTG